MDVLKAIDELRERLWSRYGNALNRDYTQDEVHMTYYAGKVLEHAGYKWFNSEGVEGACYTEKAMQAAFIAGLRVGQQDAQKLAESIADERMANAIAALRGEDA